MPTAKSVASDPLYGAVTPLTPPADAIKHDLDAANAESLAAKPRFDIRAAARKHAPLLLGLGALAAVGVAAVIGRRPLAVAAKSVARRAAKPMLFAAIRRRPLQTARFAIRQPKLVAKAVSALT